MAAMMQAHILDGAIDGARAVVLCRGAGCADDHAALASHGALAVAVKEVAWPDGPAPVSEAVGVHAIHPALHDGRQVEPPQVEYEEGHVAPACTGTSSMSVQVHQMQDGCVLTGSGGRRLRMQGARKPHHSSFACSAATSGDCLPEE